MTDRQDPAPVYAALTQPELDALQLAAENLANHASGDYPDPNGRSDPMWDVYDPARSSSGEEYVTSPDSAGWYTLVDGHPAQVTIRYVTDPVVARDVLIELDVVYALSAGLTDMDEDEETLARKLGIPIPGADDADVPGSCDISGD